MPNTLAVLITYYNEGPLLTRCLESLLAGEVLPDEILIYDDASPMPAAEYAVEHEKIRIIRGAENKGATYGRNLLLGETRCEYVHFHDSDDTFDPEWAKVIKGAITGPDAPDLVIANCRIISEVDPSDKKLKYAPEITHVDDAVRFFIRNSTSTQIATFRRSLTDQTRGYDTRDLKTSLDAYFNILMASKTISHRFINRALITVYLRPNSLTRGDDGRDRIRLIWVQHAKAMEYLGGELPVKYADELADRMVLIAAMLFNNGFEADALDIVARAYRVGRPQFVAYPSYRRFLFRVFGFTATLKIEKWARRLLPEGIQAKFRQKIQGESVHVQ